MSEQNDAKKSGERTESTFVKALRIEGIDLEPTEDELNFFLTHESTIAVEDIARAAEELLSEAGNGDTEIEKAYQQVVAMNRRNSADSFSQQARTEIERKREQLLKELQRRHQDAE